MAEATDYPPADVPPPSEPSPGPGSDQDLSEADRLLALLAPAYELQRHMNGFRAAASIPLLAELEAQSGFPMLCDWETPRALAVKARFAILQFRGDRALAATPGGIEVATTAAALAARLDHHMVLHNLPPDIDEELVSLRAAILSCDFQARDPEQRQAGTPAVSPGTSIITGFPIGSTAPLDELPQSIFSAPTAMSPVESLDQAHPATRGTSNPTPANPAAAYPPPEVRDAQCDVSVQRDPVGPCPVIVINGPGRTGVKVILEDGINYGELHLLVKKNALTALSELARLWDQGPPPNHESSKSGSHLRDAQRKVTALEGFISFGGRGGNKKRYNQFVNKWTGLGRDGTPPEANEAVETVEGY